DGASLAALRLLAQHCEPLFFQRLRVEQQIGYVVSCRYQRVADRDGASLAALRLLAQHCEPLFFQRLRVEQQIGYVV
ncbi:hypothetical protein CQA88_31990, partial [Klebsiella pneumoniae]